MTGFIYQGLILVAVLLAMPLQKNWKDRWFLLFVVLGSVALVDLALVGLSVGLVKYGSGVVEQLDWFILFLPVIVPVTCWYYAEKIIKSKHDNH